MQYLLHRNFSFFSFYIVISFLFIASLHLPDTTTAADIFSDNSSAKWETIVDSDGRSAEDTDSNWKTPVYNNRLPTNTGMGRRTNHYSPSRLDEKRIKLKTASDNNIKAEKNRAVRKSVTYSGRAEADGRSATLELHFDGNNVSGRLQAKGVSEKYIRLPSTAASFAPVKLNGAWESDDTTIFASWKGGDYIDGVRIPDYPTRGNLSIKLAERDGKKVVYLHRIDNSSFGFVFPLKGVVYTPPDAGNSNASGNGYWDPVDSWSGEEFGCPFKAVIAKSGDVTVTITCDNDNPEYRNGKWNRQGNGIKVKWSRATIKEHELEESTFYAFFDGANCLILDGGDDDGAQLYRNSEASRGKNSPKQRTFNSSQLPPDTDLSRPSNEPYEDEIDRLTGKFNPQPLQDESRPGYRSTVTPESQKFYRYIMEKIGRGEKLSKIENLTIRVMIAQRSWPEAPKISDSDAIADRMISQHDTITAEAMEAMRATAGKLDYDLKTSGDLEKFRQWYHGVPRNQRSETANLMMTYYKSLGYDMRSDAQIQFEKNKREEKYEDKARAEQKIREQQLTDEEKAKKEAQDFFERAAARDRLLEKIRQSKQDDQETEPDKSWVEMSPEQRHEALKKNDPYAWDNLENDLKDDLELNNQPE